MSRQIITCSKAEKDCRLLFLLTADLLPETKELFMVYALKPEKQIKVSYDTYNKSDGLHEFIVGESKYAFHEK